MRPRGVLLGSLAVTGVMVGWLGCGSVGPASGPTEPDETEGARVPEWEPELPVTACEQPLSLSGEATVDGAILFPEPPAVVTELRHALVARSAYGTFYTVQLTSAPRTCGDIMAWHPEPAVGTAQEVLAIHLCYLVEGEYQSAAEISPNEPFGTVCARHPAARMFLTSYRRTEHAEAHSATLLISGDDTRLTIVRGAPHRAICGAFDLSFPHAGRLRGTFAARYCEGVYPFPVEP